MRWLPPLFLLLVGCPVPEPDTGTIAITDRDRDGDGLDDVDDCAPDDATIGAGFPELCDGFDNDCDGEVDEGLPMLTLYRDQDGDGYGDPSWTEDFCAPVTGWTTDANDCGPSDRTIYPGAPEYCDGQDHDCDGFTMEADSVDPLSWWLDQDGDGFGTGLPSLACEAPVGTVGNALDCDDTRADVNPRAPEVCEPLGVDEDCDLLANDLDDWVAGGTEWYPDLDGDGWGALVEPVWMCDAPRDHVASTEDCDDEDPLVNPGATEVCNGIDDDCEGTVDEGAADPRTWYLDRDADGFGDDASTLSACDLPAGYAEFGGDCNDFNNTYHPSADESACVEGIDLNCDGFTGPEDNDGDGWAACEECDDGEFDVHPGAVEVCNGVDDDCDGRPDVDAIDGSIWYADADADGYGDPAAPMNACSEPIGYVANSADCDDAARWAYPGAPESCVHPGDDDCDGVANEIDAVGCVNWYVDEDGDLYGGDSVCACTAYDEYDTLVGEDCDDADPSTHPGALEVCGDSIDQDCSGADDDCTLSAADARIEGRTDGDGFGIAMAPAGDVDGDGQADLLVGGLGMEGVAADAGGVMLLAGPFSGVTTAASPLTFWYGSASSDDAGAAISDPVDLDGDGLPEYLVGAPRSDTADKNAGSAYLVEYSAGAQALSTVARFSVIGETAHDALGSAVLLGVDLNGDGRREAAIGAYGNDENGAESGAVYVFRMPASGEQSAVTASTIVRGDVHDRLSVLPRTATDVNGDGVHDLVVGGWGIDGDAAISGGVAVFLGPLSGSVEVAAADAVYRGEGANDDAGVAIDVRDADGDGALDLLVGAPGNDDAGANAGAAYLVLGPLTASASLSSAPLVVRGAATGDEFGSAVALVDLLDSGLAAAIVGAPGSSLGALESGAVYRFNNVPTGVLGAADADAGYPGEAADARLGERIVNVGDVDGDGRDDAGVSATGFVNDAGETTGAVYTL
jgi:hypothetical protein